MMEEELVSFELAKKLKDVGMPQDLDADYAYTVKECYSSADYSPLYKEGDRVLLDGNFSANEVVTAPTLSLVQKWLREEKCIIIQVKICDPVLPIEFESEVFYELRNIPFAHKYAGTFKTYDEALIAGIEEALKYIK